MTLWSILVAPVALGWGFSVDDVWISARVAEHWARGEGYRFNRQGPPVDAVTPLGWAHVLALLGGTDLTQKVFRARLLGLGLWCFTAIAVARVIRRESGGWQRLSPLIPWALCLPFGAWIGAGMETAVVTACCTWAALWPKAGPWCAGAAAAWRPELVPWACALVLASERAPQRRKALDLAVVLALPVLFALLRTLYFGSAVPLAFHAKPSDPAQGASYVWGALRFTGLPILLLSTSWRRLSVRDRGLGLALLVHLGAVTLAGGDWMSLFRLIIPVLPSALLLSCRLAASSSAMPVLARTALATGLLGLLIRTHLATARDVWSQRVELIEQAKPWLEGVGCVGTLDAGWVGAATPDTVIEFAGVTDPRVAHLQGGHTSKQLPEVFLSQRGIDALLILTEAGAPLRAVEHRALALALQEQFRLRVTIPLPRTRQAYQLWLRDSAGPTISASARGVGPHARMDLDRRPAWLRP